jgi:hypothetical protein
MYLPHQCWENGNRVPGKNSVTESTEEKILGKFGDSSVKLGDSSAKLGRSLAKLVYCIT